MRQPLVNQPRSSSHPRTAATMASSTRSSPWRPLDPDVAHRSGQRGRRRLQLVHRAERVAGAGHEQRGHVEAREVLGAGPVGPPRRVERVGDQHQAGRRAGPRPRPSSTSARPSSGRRAPAGRCPRRAGRRSAGASSRPSPPAPAPGRVPAARPGGRGSRPGPPGAAPAPSPAPPACGGPARSRRPGTARRPAGCRPSMPARADRRAGRQPRRRAGCGGPRPARRCAGRRPPRRRRGRGGPGAGSGGTGVGCALRRGAVGSGSKPSVSSAQAMGSRGAGQPARPLERPVRWPISSPPSGPSPAQTLADGREGVGPGRGGQLAGGVDGPEHAHERRALGREVEGRRRRPGSRGADGCAAAPPGRPGGGGGGGAARPACPVRAGPSAARARRPPRPPSTTRTEAGGDAAEQHAARNRARDRWAGPGCPSASRRVGAIGPGVVELQVGEDRSDPCLQPVPEVPGLGATSSSSTVSSALSSSVGQLGELLDSAGPSVEFVEADRRWPRRPAGGRW